MPIPTTEQIHAALRGDLKKADSIGFKEVVNDVVRKTFTARNADAIYEFAHKQPDAAFWNGVKYYGSGKQNRIKFRRTPAKVAVPKGRKAAAEAAALVAVA
jgi:hypothetical protein